MRCVVVGGHAVNVHGYIRATIDTGILVDGTRFASLEWLRKMKAAAGRAKDLLDRANLPQLERP